MAFQGFGKSALEGEKITILHKSILRTALALRKKHRTFDMLTLFERCCKELPNPEPEIDRAIRELYQWKYLIPGKQLFKHEILDNDKRNQIYDYVLEYPGAHEREVRRAFALGAYEAHIHLAFLTKYGFFRRRTYKNKIVFFIIDFDEAQELEVLILRNETASKLYECIKERQEVRLTELSDILQIPYTTIQMHLRDLVEGQLIKKTQKERITYYSLPKIPIEVPTQKELVEVKREYDYVGGKIRFKVVIRNYTDMIIHNIGVNLNPSDQFIVDTPQQTVTNLPPNTTRGIDFDLTPLSCGQSKVFGSISFEDAFGKAHSRTIQPKEIAIKCPLVTPLAANQAEVNEWIKSLKRGTSKINYQEISNMEAFRIGREQVGALDLSEITVNPDQMWGLFSGQVKVTGKNTVVKVSISGQQIILDVWADDLKQTTGFLAYISNLINIALEVSYKTARKTADISRKIIDLMKMSRLADETFGLCQNLRPIHEIMTCLSNMQAILQESFPESILIQAIKFWTSKFESLYEPQSPIEACLASELQFKDIRWLYKIQELLQTHMKMYKDTFDDLSQLNHDLSEGIEFIGERIGELERDYGLGILSYLLILDKNSGLTFFEKNFGDMQINPDLVGGFLHALQSFGTELGSSGTSMKTLTYESYQFQIETGNYVRAALILRGSPNHFLISRLEKFVKQFEQNFQEHIIHFSGNITDFRVAKDLFQQVFH